LLDELHIDQPAWDSFSSLESATRFAEKVGFPVLVRPSYVLSGSNMKICHTLDELTAYAAAASTISQKYPVTVSKFITDAKELEVDCVAEKGYLKAFIVSEHVEYAGVHSGDASILLPAQKVYVETIRRLKTIARDIAKALEITGPFNIQCLAKNNDVSVIEVNLRSSRTFPFISKVTKKNFIEMATDAFFSTNSREIQMNSFEFDFVAAKVAQFSFARLTGADPVLDVEMSSTGEVACFGDDTEEAFLKAELSVGAKIPQKGIFISLGGEENKILFFDCIERIRKLNIPIYATEKTAKYLRRNNIQARRLYKIHEKKGPNVLQYFQQGKIDMVIIITDKNIKKEVNDDYAIRRAAVDQNISLFTDHKKVELFIKAISEKKLSDLYIKSWNEYYD
jgi:carbamoyl-phosphate synthase large subunit